MSPRSRLGPLLALVLLGAGAVPGAAREATQVVPAGAPGTAGIEAAVEVTNDGWIRFSFETRDGVEICPRGIRWGENHWVSAGRGPRDRAACAPGPAEVDLEVRDGVVRRVELAALSRSEPVGARDLGPVAAAEAARFLVSLAGGAASGGAAEDAILPAFLARVPEIWRELARLAGDGSLPDDVRESALFWLGQEAASAATAGIAAVAADEAEDQDVREAAVFALSQRPPEQGVPILMDLARSAEQAETRRTAFFWLAQVEDDRVVAFFEEVLLEAPRE